MIPFFKNENAETWRIDNLIEAPAGFCYLVERGSVIDVCRVSNGKSIASGPVTTFVDANGAPYADLAALRTAVNGFFVKPQGGTGAETDPIFEAWRAAAELLALTTGDANGRVVIDKDGVRFEGTATVWEDYNLDPTALSGTGTLPSKIKLNTTNIPIAAFASSGIDEVAGVIEYPHKGKLNAVGETSVFLSFHFHYRPRTVNAGNALFKLEFISTREGVVAGTSTTISVLVPMSGKAAWEMHSISFPNITAPDSLGQQFHFRFYRDGSDATDTYTGDVAISTIGFHYEIDANGSSQMLVK